MPLNFPLPTRSVSSPDPTRLGSLHARNVTAFRACYQRFEDCREFASGRSASPVMEAASDFTLDFEIVAKRAIGAEAARHRLFALHFLDNHDRDACCAKLNMTPWTFAAEILRIEQVVGQALSRSGLFPLAPYFNRSSRSEKLAA